MITTNHKHVAHLAEICYQHGLRHVVVSPGSRNAPLIIAFDEHPGIKTWLIHDERSAAFFALGLIDATGEPVAVTCTSGSAPLNYAPAIAEAYYRRKPLLILTADRPLLLVDQGDGQTIRQKNVFTNYIKASFELPDFSVETDLSLSDKIVNDAIHELKKNARGPVHVNIPLNEPLYGRAELTTKPAVENLPTSEKQLSLPEKNTIENIWKDSDKKLILVGQLDPDAALLRELMPLLGDPSVALLVENTSNLYNFSKIVHCIDRTLALISDEEAINFKPDLLITCGGAVISKKIKAFFRKNKPKVTWRVGEYLFEEDTFQSLTQSFDVNEKSFFNYVASIDYLPRTNYGDHWKQKDFLAREQHDVFLDKSNWSDFAVFKQLLDVLPENISLHMANSSVVRYCQLFDPAQDIRYYANRGVSGIDGSTSTAVGFAVADSTHVNVLITGDISFLYDSNALWNKYLPDNLKIIVINNGGGAIFKILDGPSESPQADYFFSPYEADLKSLCLAFNLKYLSASDATGLDKALNTAFVDEHNTACVIEVKTFSQKNEEVLKNYFTFLRLASGK